MNDRLSALEQLAEAADLLAMVEELLNSGNALPNRSIAGMRLTLQSARYRVLRCRETLRVGEAESASESVTARASVGGREDQGPEAAQPYDRSSDASGASAPVVERPMANAATTNPSEPTARPQLANPVQYRPTQLGATAEGPQIRRRDLRASIQKLGGALG